MPQKANINSMEDYALHDEFNKYIVSVISSMRSRGYENGCIDIEVSAEHYNGEGVEVKYSVNLNNTYAGKVTSDNLGKSAHIALSRWEEDEKLKVKSIPFMVDAA